MFAGDDWRTERLHAAAGEALHLAQALEASLTTLIAIVNDHLHSGVDVEGLVVSDHRKTLGQLIQQLQSVGAVDGTGVEILDDALQSRNYVSHQFFIKNTYAFTVDEKFDEAVAKLQTHTAAIAKGTALTLGWLDGLCHALSLDKDKILFRQD